MLSLLSLKEKEIISSVFSSLSCNSYVVGGFLRDKLLNRESFDIDFATDVKPEILKDLFPFTSKFFKMGSFSFKKEQFEITVTTFRKETDYFDFRHPSSISFVDDINIDYLRRDFTINSLYMDKDYHIIDPSSMGVSDIKNHLIRTIGESEKRIIEDPLRIIRALRFSFDLDFEIDDKLYHAIIENKDLLYQLKKEKVLAEINKCKKNKLLIRYLEDKHVYKL